MREFLTTLHNHDKFIELRAIPPKTSKYQIERHFTKDIDDAIDWIKPLIGTHNIYTGVCPRDEAANKISTTSWAWADVDTKSGHAGSALLDIIMSRLVLTPTIIVASGGDNETTGYHLYWASDFTDDLAKVQRINNSIADLIKGDHVGDAARILRVPSTLNHKYDPPRTVSLVHCQPELIYSWHDLGAMTKVGERPARIVHTGDSRQHKSRSERDFAVVLALLRAGMSDDGIMTVFTTRAVADKQGEHDNPEHYLLTTIESAREELGLEPGETLERNDWGIFELRGSAYAKITREGSVQRVSTFVMEPTAVLESDDAEDVIICNIKNDQRSWPNVSVPKSAFTRHDALVKHLTSIEHSWLGTDSDLRRLLPYLADQIRKNNVPTRQSTSILGRHGEVFVAPNVTFDAHDILEQPPIVWLSTGGEYPNLHYSEHDPAEVAEVADAFASLYFDTNRPDVVWPMLGFYVAALYKPVLSVPFPVLSVFGTRGAGKTTMLTKILQPLVGYEEPRTYNANTTNFVLLSLLSSVNAVPVSISEYRVSSLRDPSVLSRFILLSYDGGYDSRGRPDQTTVKYELDTPFTIDGEDVITDPAALERAIIVNMSPEQIQPGTPENDAFEALSGYDLRVLSMSLVQYTLGHNIDLAGARAEVDKRYSTISERVRKNISVVLAGMNVARNWLESLGLQVPAYDFDECLAPCVENVVNPTSGRTVLAVDTMVEDVINHIVKSNGTTDFLYDYDTSDGIFYLHLSSAYKWWATAQRRAGQPILTQSSIRVQLKEREGLLPGEYVVSVGNRYIARSQSQAWMYGIDLGVAIEANLDIPSKINVGNIFFDYENKVVNFGGGNDSN